MLLSQFHKRFPDEAACEAYLREVRAQQVVTCLICGDVTHKWVNGKNAFQCEKCGCRVPLSNGTLMERSKLTLMDWFYPMHLMTSIKLVLSAKEVQYLLGQDQYPPVWLMMMKLRSIMGKRDSMYQLSDEVELDEAFFIVDFKDETNTKYNIQTVLITTCGLKGSLHSDEFRRY
jgi:hypothetical protein